jgi:5-methyltetrahydropteroyltriglutamate--homocysteine methyltransferase
VAQQERLGLLAVTDGEFRRGLWHLDFLQSFTNVSTARSPVAVKFHTDQGDRERLPSALKVDGPFARTRPIFVDHFRFLKSVTRAEPKLTIPSPTVLHFRGGRQAVDQVAYPRMEASSRMATACGRVRDLGLAGCRYLQVDEVNFATSDPSCVRRSADGRDPATLPRTYARLINAAIATRPPGMTVACTCAVEPRAPGWPRAATNPWRDALQRVDVQATPGDSSRAGDFAPLRFVPGKRVVRAVTTKRGTLKQGRSRGGSTASRVLPLDQLARASVGLAAASVATT